MANPLFLIGVGGTGMRCLESFVHLCAAGKMSGRSIHMLALDTDHKNGNFEHLRVLVEKYQAIKGGDSNGSDTKPVDDNFFGAQLHFYTYSPDYSQQKTRSFNSLTGLLQEGPEKDLANLLLPQDVQSFNLEHGYRAQTHLGSMLMYHAILGAAQATRKRPEDVKLRTFIEKLGEASAQDSARCFVCGSVFGGTGASSIPVIPQAFDAALRQISTGKTLEKLNWGATLLTSYFTFPEPSKEQSSQEKVIASSSNFKLNCQAALMHYFEDASIKNAYRHFYILGDSQPFDMAQGKAEKGRTITGGSEQKNPAHYLELFSAASVVHFFNAELQSNGELEYFYRTIPQKGIDFADVFGKKDADEMAKRLGALLATSVIANGPDLFFDQVLRDNIEKMPSNVRIDQNALNALKDYFTHFHFSHADAMQNGWVRQLWHSLGGGDRFLFHPQLLGLSNPKEVAKFKFNEQLFSPEKAYAHKKFKTGLFSSCYDSFKKEFVKNLDPQSPAWKQSEAIAQPAEKLLKITYSTWNSLYGFADQ